VYFRQTNDQKGVMNINGFLFILQVQMCVGNPMAVVNVRISFTVALLERHRSKLCVKRGWFCKSQLRCLKSQIANAVFSLLWHLMPD